MQDGRGGQGLAAARRDEMIEQTAGARAIGLGENIRSGEHGFAEPRQQCGAAVEAGERIVGARLKGLRQIGLAQLREPARIRAQGIAVVGRKQSGFEQAQGREREPFRTRNRQPGGGIAIAPVGTGAGVEQYRYDGEIEFGACARPRVRPFCFLRNLGPQIAAAEDEMAPACVQRHQQVGIIIADDIGDEARDRRQAREIDGEMRELAADPRRQHFGRALAHRARREKRERHFTLAIERMREAGNG